MTECLVDNFRFLPMDLQHIVYHYVEPEVDLAVLFPTDDHFHHFLCDVAYEYQGHAVEIMLDDFTDCFPHMGNEHYDILSRFTYCYRERVEGGRKIYQYDALDNFDYIEYVNVLYELLCPMLRSSEHSHTMYELVKKYIHRYENATKEE